MLFESEKTFFTSVLNDGLSGNFSVHKVEHVGGGDINHAVKVTTSADSFFVKWNQFAETDMFEKEMDGLVLLSQTDCMDVVKPLNYGTHEGKHFLILEHIERGRQNRYFWEEFGRNLAKLHQNSHSQFGLQYDNYIGRLPQSNKPDVKWNQFFIEQRLTPLVAQGREKGIISRGLLEQFESFYKIMDELIPTEQPALLHGDLWSGNFICGPNGQAWLIDPAVYYGNREMELAFTQLFGGFDQRFYQSYQEAFPLIPGFDDRVEIHNLYPLLVHLNLFGSSYLSGIISTLNKYT